MRTVLKNHQEVSHVWAQQEQQTGKSGNMFFDGPTIYSYGGHFPIASFQANEAGEKAVLFTTDSYSVSTAKHISYTHRALRSGQRVFNVPSIMLRYSDAHQHNLQSYRERINAEMEKAVKARLHTESHVQTAERLTREMRDYAAFFAVELGEVPNVELSDELRQRIKDRQASAKEAKRAREQAERQRLQEYMDKWIAGEDVRYSLYAFPTALRIKDDTVETSRGANFPVEHARLGLALVRRVIARGTEWKQNGEQCRLGFYRIDRITPDGTVYAGCHVVTFPAIERIASALESIAEVPANV